MADNQKKGFFDDIKKIEWPAKKDLFVNSVQIVIVTLFFAGFFFLCQIVISFLLNIVGGR